MSKFSVDINTIKSICEVNTPELINELVNFCEVINTSLMSNIDITKLNNSDITIYGKKSISEVLDFYAELESAYDSEQSSDVQVAKDTAAKKAEILTEAVKYVKNTLGNGNLNSLELMKDVAVNFTLLKAKMQYNSMPKTGYANTENLLETKALKTLEIDMQKGAVSVAEDVGLGGVYGRSKQEDTLVFAELNENFDDNAAIKYLSFINNSIGNETKANESGSTAVMSYYNAETKTLSYSNLGDSRIMQVVLNQDGTIDPDNTYNLSQDQEALYPVRKKMVEKADGYVMAGNPKGMFYNRVNGDIKCGGAFGDSNVPMPNTPDYGQVKYADLIKEGKNIFVIVFCDGIVDRDSLNPYKISEIVRDYNKASSSEKDKFSLASLLLRKAIDGGSQDNISVQVANINNAQNSFINAVFDGHGGKETAQQAKQVMEKLVKQYEIVNEVQTSQSPTSVSQTIANIIENKSESHYRAPNSGNYHSK
ncbi:MAG: protein phosphatase 2C family protein [Alphaproteobacteria bacterium]|nr:protein phosphatase 2C family protein [Alphaproteobacteria bacterium]OJV13700.1 MAG: hypothetical protein BGO27_00825 [Alphaproteobacteria bacterium 33-17]